MVSSQCVSSEDVLMYFLGTQVDVHGVIPVGKGPLMANYTIDNEEPRTRSVPALLQNTYLEFQTLFSSGLLDMGEHTITIDILSTGVGRNYTFQKFAVMAVANGTSMSGSGDTSGLRNGGGSGDGNGTGESGGSDGGSTNKDKSINDLKTAVIVLGSSILLILVLFGAFFVWRKKTNSVQRKGDCEKEAIQSGASVARHGRPIHPSGDLNADNISTTRGDLLDMQSDAGASREFGILFFLFFFIRY